MDYWSITTLCADVTAQYATILGRSKDRQRGGKAISVTEHTRTTALESGLRVHILPRPAVTADKSLSEDVECSSEVCRVSLYKASNHIRI
jgi:hypothetical protein